MADDTHANKIVSRKDAIALGLPHYFTGKPCRRGHVAKRHTLGAYCTECAYLNTARIRRDNKEHYLELDRAQKRKDRQLLRARDKVRYWNNPEKAKARTREYYKLNAEAVKAKARQTRADLKRSGDKRYLACAEKNRIRVREWAAKNPEAVRSHLRNLKAQRRNVAGKHSASDIKEIISLQNNRCACCKKRLTNKRHVDHIVPISKGGTNDRRNLQVLCPPCNLAKGAIDPIAFMQSKGLLL